MIILIFFFLLIALLRLLSPIVDPDFFWHLATGRWIVEHGSLPDSDPFSYSTLPLKSAREKFILTSYWLSQVTYYIIYDFFGYSGIISIRFLIIGLILFFLIKRSIINGMSYPIYIPLIFLSLIVLLFTYPMDRPQIFSFLFFVVLLYLLDSLIRGGKYGIFLIPLLMVLWSNAHGGFILGQVVLFAYLIGDVIKSIFLKSNLNKKLIVTSLSGIIAGFLNPNIHGAIVETMRASTVITEGIIEYMSTIEYFLTFGAIHTVIYWFILLLAIISVIYSFKRDFDIKNLIIILGLGYFSFTQSRYMAFLVLFVPPIIGGFISSLRWRRSLELSLFFISILFGATLVFKGDLFLYLKNIDSVFKGRFISSIYPESAVRFILAISPKERMYNYYGWGGYLIWRFYPEKRVFVDGRQLYEDVYMLSRSINDASIEPYIGKEPYWKAILKSYNINYVLIPFFEKSGNVLPLFIELFRDNEWVPVFFTKNSVVFVRVIPEHYNITYKYSIPKDLLVVDAIGQLELAIKKNPTHIRLYIAKGDLLLFSGRIKEAEAEYRRALEVFPLSAIAKEKLDMLKRLRVQ